jgi:hypothetical protein
MKVTLNKYTIQFGIGFNRNALNAHSSIKLKMKMNILDKL